jgi:hypothetical protein
LLIQVAIVRRHCGLYNCEKGLKPLRSHFQLIRSDTLRGLCCTEGCVAFGIVDVSLGARTRDTSGTVSKIRLAQSARTKGQTYRSDCLDEDAVLEREAFQGNPRKVKITKRFPSNCHQRAKLGRYHVCNRSFSLSKDIRPLCLIHSYKCIVRANKKTPYVAVSKGRPILPETEIPVPCLIYSSSIQTMSYQTDGHETGLEVRQWISRD